MSSVPRNQHEYSGRSARDYESARAADPKWRREQEIVTAYLRDGLAADSTVLDVPIGTGRFLPLYNDLGCAVIGVDMSEDMLTEARQKAGAGVRLVQGDVTNLELGDSSVDVAVCVRFANLVPLETVRSALSELSRVSRSHVVFGVRTYARPAAPRQALRRARARFRKRPDKLTIHRNEDVMSIFAAVGLAVAKREEVTEAAGGSSTYDLFLLRAS